MAITVQTPDTEELNESKTFICLNDKCARGVVHVDAGHKAGDVIKHACGTKASLAYADGSWGLSTLEELEPPKKKRGRPRKEQPAVQEPVEESKVVEIQPLPDIPEEIAVGGDFLNAAQESDKRIDKALHRGGENFFEAVKELVENRKNGYYKALGYETFSSYRETKSQYSRSHIYQMMQSYEALHSRIPDNVLAKIPVPTAVLLTRIPESKLTNEVIEAAQTMKIADFKEHKFPALIGQLVDASTGEAQPLPDDEYAWIPRMRVHKPVADAWRSFLEIARWKAAGLTDENDVLGNYSLEEKALLAIYYECAKASNWEADYDAARHVGAVEEEPAF